LEPLVAQITGLLGIDAATAKLVLVGLLDIARQSLGPEASAALLAQIPGAAELAGSSLLGSTGISLSALLGGGGPGPEALAELVRESGLSGHEVASIADMLLDYTREHAGPEVADRLHAAIPGLAWLG
jgi:hypothetical protein